MIRYFNIKDNDQNSLYPHHSIHADTFRKIVDSFNLELSMLINQVSLCYIDNFNEQSFYLTIFIELI